MARVSTYLNFMGDTGEAFEFYRSVFGTDYLTPPMRMKEMPADPGMPVLTEAEGELIMHVSLPIVGGHVIMGSDMLASAGHTLRVGNNVTMNLELDKRAQTESLFAELSAGSAEVFGLAEMPWGAYWGTCLDQFNVRWMFSCAESA